MVIRNRFVEVLSNSVSYSITQAHSVKGSEHKVILDSDHCGVVSELKLPARSFNSH